MGTWWESNKSSHLATERPPLNIFLDQFFGVFLDIPIFWSETKNQLSNQWPSKRGHPLMGFSFTPWTYRSYPPDLERIRWSIIIFPIILKMPIGTVYPICSKPRRLNPYHTATLAILSYFSRFHKIYIGLRWWNHPPSISLVFYLSPLKFDEGSLHTKRSPAICETCPIHFYIPFLLQGGAFPFWNVCWWLLNTMKLVGGWATPLNHMSSSIGMMTFPIYGKVKNGIQTTNQINLTSSIDPP